MNTLSHVDFLTLMGLLGYRTATRKQGPKPPRMVIETLIVKKTAEKIKSIFPNIDRLHLVGSRLRHRDARDIEFVAVVEDPRNLIGRTIVNVFDRPDDKDIKPGVSYPPKVDLFFSLPSEVEAHILEFGLGLDNIHWKKAAQKKGYRLTRYGLFKGSVLVTQKMAQIARLLRLKLKPRLVYSLENPY